MTKSMISKSETFLFDDAMEYVTNFGTAIDVGACRGAWTKRMVKRFSTVHAFEPSFWLSDQLSHLFTKPDVIIHNVAILDSVTKGRLVYDAGYENKPRSHYVSVDLDGEVEVKTIDSFKFRDCGLLKIDVEGGELPVLRGARQIIRHQKPVIIVECKYRLCNRFGWNRLDLFSYMHSLGYKMVVEEKPNLLFVSKST